MDLFAAAYPDDITFLSALFCAIFFVPACVASALHKTVLYFLKKYPAGPVVIFWISWPVFLLIGFSEPILSLYLIVFTAPVMLYMLGCSMPVPEDSHQTTPKNPRQ